MGWFIAPVVSRSFAHRVGDNTIWLCSTPILIGGGQKASHLSSAFYNRTRRLADRRMFRVTPCRTATIHLKTSMLSPDSNLGPTAQPSASLTTIPYGRHLLLTFMLILYRMGDIYY
ncbi:hypothetical protein TNCV_2678541 [Trichonephila clavipes]|nr:hypothetical protein TNCV_2678541 [Trichonephila clavipes]